MIYRVFGRLKGKNRNLGEIRGRCILFLFYVHFVYISEKSIYLYIFVLYILFVFYVFMYIVHKKILYIIIYI